jgi:hypothetical protein
VGGQAGGRRFRWKSQKGGLPPGLSVCGGDSSRNAFRRCLASAGCESRFFSAQYRIRPLSWDPYIQLDFPTTEKGKELALARGVSFPLQLRGRVPCSAYHRSGGNIKEEHKTNISTTI